jgi:hypothetical protein
MGSGGITSSFLSSALDGREWSASRSCRFIPGKTAVGTLRVGGWVDPRASPDFAEKENNFPFRESNPDSSAVQAVA